MLTEPTSHTTKSSSLECSNPFRRRDPHLDYDARSPARVLAARHPPIPMGTSCTISSPARASRREEHEVYTCCSVRVDGVSKLGETVARHRTASRDLWLPVRRRFIRRLAQRSSDQGRDPVDELPTPFQARSAARSSQDANRWRSTPLSRARCADTSTSIFAPRTSMTPYVGTDP